MLDLSGSPRVVAGVTVAPDTAGPGQWWVLPPAPRPAPGPNAGDGPDLQLIRFVTNGTVTGGYLRLGLQMAVAEADLAAATAALAAENSSQPVTLTPLPLLSAAADLAFFGRDPAPPGDVSPLVARQYSSTGLGTLAPYRGAFAVILTADGVHLVESGLRSAAVPIGVHCRLTVEGLWPSARVTALVDWHSVYDHLSSEYNAGALLVGEDVQHLMQTLVQDRVVQVSAVVSPVPGSDPSAESAAVDAALRFIQSDLLESFCEPLLPPSTDPAKATLGDVGEFFDLGGAYQVKALTEIESATAHYDFQQATVARRTVTSQSVLGDLLAGADPSGYILDAGPLDPFFAQFHLDCHTARPLADSHLAEAILDISYGTRSGSVDLTPAAPSGSFQVPADASADGTWTLAPRVTFASDSPVDSGTLVALAPATGTARDVTLDLDALLGLVRLDVVGTSDVRVAATVLTVTAAAADGTQRGQQSLTMQPAKPMATAWFRGIGPGDTLTVAGQHLLADGDELQIPPAQADTTLFRLPDPFAGTITVQIVTDAVWTELTHVEVAIQKDTNSPARTFAFDAPGTAAVALDQLNPKDRSYRYMVSRVVAGVTTEDPWLTGDLPILSIGRVSAAELVVDVEPVGPELPVAGLRVVQVELVYVDAPHQLRVEHTHIIQAKADSYQWVVPIADPTLRTYQYRITKTLLAGGDVSTGWLDSSDPILTVALTAS